MNLYLDLNKAKGQATGGKDTKKEEQAIASDSESYLESPSGVNSGDVATYDDPDVGRKWTHGEDESADAAIEAKRQKRNKRSQDRNLTPTEEEVGIKKAFDESSLDMVKSLTSGLRDSLGLNKYTRTEVEFLQVVKGFSMEEIQKGNITIIGKDRQLFSAWLCDRVQKSLDGLYRR
jgi:hypothetical protein